MDIIKTLKIEQKNKNYYGFKNGRFNIKIKIPYVLCPFGIDKEYNHHVLKLELQKSNNEHQKILEQIKNFEDKIKNHFNVKENEWKSIIHERDNGNIFLEPKIKHLRNKLIIDLSYEDSQNNYLKTIYELEKNKNMDVVLEIPTLWDFRIEDEENTNKIGFLLNVNKIHVY